MSKLTVIVLFTMGLVVTTTAQKSIYNKPYEQWKPLLTEANKKFTFDVAPEFFKKEGKELRKVTFEVGKLVHNGQVIF